MLTSREPSPANGSNGSDVHRRRERALRLPRERRRARELFDAHLPVLRAEKGDGHPWTRRAADRAVALYRAIGDRTRELALATIVERR